MQPDIPAIIYRRRTRKWPNPSYPGAGTLRPIILIMRKFNDLFKRVGVSPFSPKEFQGANTRSGTRVTRNGLPLKNMLLPNVDLFTVLGKTMDDLAKELHGIERAKYRRYRAKSFMSNPANDYLRRMYERLYGHALKGEHEKFEQLSNHMMRHSVALRLVAMNNVADNWYKSLKWSKVTRAWDKLCQLCISKQNHHLTVKKVLIPKQDGTMRPLGVPNLSYRMYMHMIQLLMNIWLRDRRPVWQHGFRPWHGTGTAWLDIAHNVIPAKFIWEFDMRKFFDSIRVESIAKGLKYHKTPNFITEWITQASEWVAESKDRDIAGEIMDRALEMLRTGQAAAIDATKLIAEAMKANVQRKHALHNVGSEEKSTDIMMNRGVPQGCNISPISAVIAIETAMKDMPHDASMIMYADDGIIFGDDEIEVKKAIKYLRVKALEIGTSIHEKKSKWIKTNGEWNCNLKFLGIEYLPEQEIIKGHTRNGSRIMAPIMDIKSVNFADFDYNTLSPTEKNELLKDGKPNSWLKFWGKKKLLGVIMAYLYNKGELNKNEPGITSELTVETGSFLDLHEAEIVNSMEAVVELSIKNLSTVSMRVFMRKLINLDKKLGKRLSKIKAIRKPRLANRPKKLKSVPMIKP